VIDDSALKALAAAQHGLVSVGQMVELGYARHQRLRLVEGARWERLTPRVVRLVGAPATTHQRAMSSVLDGGYRAALVSRSALAFWGITSMRLEPFEIGRERGRSGLPHRGGLRHDPCLLPEHHIRVLEGIRLATPARALFDVAGTQRRGAELPWWVERMERLTDVAWSMRLVSGATLHDMLDELAQRGRPGIRTMRQVLVSRPRSYTPPASGLEARFEQILRDAGLPPMRRQVDMGDEQGWIGRVDFRDARLPLVVEIQSERFHTSLTDRAADRERIRRLRGAGLEVVEIGDAEVWQHRGTVVRRVIEARTRLLRLAPRSLSAPKREPVEEIPRFRCTSSTGSQRWGGRGVRCGGRWRGRRSRP
jgi:very-short-patch-repair endonuclease